MVYLLKLSSECLVSYDPHFPGNDGTKNEKSDSTCGNGNERREKVYLVECERSGPHLEIPYLFLLTDCECGTRNLSTSFFPLRRAQNEAGMEGSTTESVGASTAEISGVFGRGVVENESLAAFGEVKCAGRRGGGGKGRHGFAAPQKMLMGFSSLVFLGSIGRVVTSA